MFVGENSNYPVSIWTQDNFIRKMKMKEHIKLGIYHLIIVLLISLWLFSCSKTKTDNILINIEQKENVSIKEHFLSIDLIPLETSDSVLIGRLTKIVQNNKKYYVLDKKQRAVFIFDLNGKFLNKIDKKGNGPGEYTEISDFEINQYSGNIELLSPWGIIYVYDKRGKFIRNYKVPDVLKVMHFLKFISENKVLLYCMTEKDRLFLFDRVKNELISLSYNIPDNVLTKSFTTYFPMYSLNNEIHLKENFSNSIYKIQGDEIIKEFTWDFGSLNIELEKIKSKKESIDKYLTLIKEGGNNSFVYPFYMNLENENTIFTIFGYDKNYNHLVLNKKTKRYILFDKYEEDVIFPFFYTFSSMDHYLSAIDISLFEISDFVKPEFLTETNRHVLEKINPNDNPIIISYKLNPNFCK
ncbi:MAG: 6-bladed beta-propeller [Draconibacterium sp.]|nr:6-bladed beta-propeller [Draconibacterium sp.]